MNKIIIGSLTVTENPQRMTIIEKNKAVAAVKTYSGIGIFQWTAEVAGVTCDLEWDNLSETLWDSMQTLYESPNQITFNPQNGSTYTVIVENLQGKYINYGLEDIPHRENVVLTLRIIS